MIIITWNVYGKNRRVAKLLDFAFSKNPDIICLQEIPFKALENLKNRQGYHIFYTEDIENVRENKNTYICTLTKQKPEKTDTLEYFDRETHSLLNDVLYKKINKNLEKHRATLTYLTFGQREVVITNARLSCAVGTNDRLEQFENMLKNLNLENTNIVCGDFNVVDSKFFNRATGWIRGLKKADYLTNERQAFEKLCEKYKLKNIFLGAPTTIFPKIKLQFDHILVSPELPVTHKEISRKGFGSDHKMLLINLEIEPTDKISTLD